MNETKELKILIYEQLLKITDRKIETAMRAVESAKEARDNETKSSVGDKYETGRAIMQFELEKNEVQLSKALNQKKELSQIDFRKEYTKVEFGSLVISDQGNYFISIGIGKIEIKNEICYSVSLTSPVGKLFHNKKIGDKIHFQAKEYTIKNIG